MVQQLVARARAEWRLQTIRGGCVMCRAFPVDDETRRDRAADLRRLEGHHVLKQQHLKKHGHVDKLWDPRGGMCLCAYHHPRHENWAQRVPRSLLPAAAQEFADELGLGWLIDREYPT